MQRSWTQSSSDSVVVVVVVAAAAVVVVLHAKDNEEEEKHSFPSPNRPKFLTRARRILKKTTLLDETNDNILIV